MIEVSVMEMALLVLNVIGWAGLFHYREQHTGARRFLHALLADDNLRDSVVREFKEFRAQVERSS
jgi:hypothetical protein